MSADRYPKDHAARAAIDVESQLHDGCTSAQYKEELGLCLRTAFARFSPDIVIHNAGSDILQGDPLGGCALLANRPASLSSLQSRELVGSMRAQQILFQLALLSAT